MATVYDVESISDLNSDGIDDCIAGAADDTVHCIDGKTGTELWLDDTPGGTIYCVTSVSDLNSNGVPEVVAGSGDSYVYIFEGGEGENNKVKDKSSDTDLPSAVLLSPNYPNPFNSETIINFQVSQYERVMIEIFNVEGELISRLVNDYFQPGSYNIRWKGKDNYGISVPTGVYFYRLQASHFSCTRRMLYLK